MILDTFGSPAWQESDANDRIILTHNCGCSYRDWLMTPRDDLGGRMPRELLHGATEWSDRVIWGQHLRFQDGEPMVGSA